MTLTLAITEYVVVSSSLDSSIETRIESDLKQHQLVKLAIESGIFNILRQNPADDDVVRDVVTQTSESMNVNLIIYKNDSNVSLFASEPSLLTIIEKPEFTVGTIGYSIEKTDDLYLLVAISECTQNEYTMQILTYTDVTAIFDASKDLQTRCSSIFLVLFAAGAIVAVAFSVIITRPIKQLTRVGETFAQGDYSRRATSFPRDEIGDLAHTINKMADSIEEKIDQLELSVKQQEDFTAAFAHELKTPMTSIIGYADTLYSKRLSPSEANEAAGYILNEGMRLEALSFKLMELINISKSEFLLEETNMIDFFKDVEGSVAHLSNRRGIPVEFHCEPGYCKMEIDLFKTMILNLIDNAMKAEGKNVAVLGWVEGEYYRIAIVDNGRGIPENELNRVTEAFYMVDKARSRKQKGAGLGLALCQKIAVIHHSSLEIQSKVGRGTAVRLKLKLEGEQLEDDDE